MTKNKTLNKKLLLGAALIPAVAVSSFAGMVSADELVKEDANEKGLMAEQVGSDDFAVTMISVEPGVELTEEQIQAGDYNPGDYARSIDSNDVRLKNTEKEVVLPGNVKSAIKLLQKSLQDRGVFHDAYGSGIMTDTFKKDTDEALKELNNGRNQSILNAMKSNDWQPYYEIQAAFQPAHYERVDGKLQPNKSYYGMIIETTLRHDPNETNEAKIQKEKRLAELIVDFKKAPGLVPHVIGLNHDESLAKKYDVEKPTSEFYNSKYNGAMISGKYSEQALKKEAEKLKAETDKKAETNKVEADKKAEADQKADTAVKVAAVDTTVTNMPNEENKLMTLEIPTDGATTAVTTKETDAPKLSKEVQAAHDALDLINLDLKDRDGVIYGETSLTFTDKFKEVSDNAYKNLNTGRNASIQEAVRTGDWQPYYNLQAKNQPAHYDLVDGQYKPNKMYFGMIIESHLRGNSNADMKDDKRLAELVKDFKEAPGMVPYVVHFNNNMQTAKKFDVEQPKSEFYDSKYNGAMFTGKFTK